MIEERTQILRIGMVRLGFEESKPHYRVLDELQKKYFNHIQTVVQRRKASIIFSKEFQKYIDKEKLVYHLGGFYYEEK